LHVAQDYKYNIWIVNIAPAEIIDSPTISKRSIRVCRVSQETNCFFLLLRHELIIRKEKFGGTPSISKNVLWYEESSSSDAALTKPHKIENAHSTRLTCLYLGYVHNLKARAPVYGSFAADEDPLGTVFDMQTKTKIIGRVGVHIADHGGDIPAIFTRRVAHVECNG